MREWLNDRRYELLLFALVQHLFFGVLPVSSELHAQVFWPLNMVVLGAASLGVFRRPSEAWLGVRHLLSLLVLLLPFVVTAVGERAGLMQVVSVTYVVYFLAVFREVLAFLIRPGVISANVISASACGYFVLLELSVFLLQAMHYRAPGSFRGIDTSSAAATFSDLVYFCAITLTSIGFGDITPASSHTKLLVALIGVVGQFYLVVLVGIVISKFASNPEP